MHFVHDFFLCVCFNRKQRSLATTSLLWQGYAKVFISQTRNSLPSSCSACSTACTRTSVNSPPSTSTTALLRMTGTHPAPCLFGTFTLVVWGERRPCSAIRLLMFMMCRQGQCRQYDQEQTTMTESELRLLRSLRGPCVWWVLNIVSF